MRNVLWLAVALAVLLTVPAVTQTVETPEPNTPTADAPTEAPTCSAAAPAEALIASGGEAGEAGIEGVGIPEPTEMVCADEWNELRWVYAGCCSGNLKRTKEQRRHCCFNNSGTSCGSWVDTGAVKCSGPCPV